MKALCCATCGCDTRRRGGFGLALAFFLIVCTLVPFGVGPQGGTLVAHRPGILWWGAAGLPFVAGPHFALDFEDGSLTCWRPRPCRLKARWRSRRWRIG